MKGNVFLAGKFSDEMDFTVGYTTFIKKICEGDMESIAIEWTSLFRPVLVAQFDF